MKKNYLLIFLLTTCFFFKVSAQCNPPTSLAVTNITGTTANLSWDPDPLLTMCDLIIQPFGSPAPGASSSGMITSANQFVASGLTACTTYQVYLRKFCPQGGASAWAGPLTFNTFPGLNCTATITQNITCNHLATITAMATGGNGNYSYTLVDLLGGSANITNFSGVFPNVDFGPYEVIADLNSNCSASSGTITIAQFSPLVCSPLVSNDSVTVLPSEGTAPYSFSVNGGAFQLNNVFNNLAPGVYVFTVRDALGCTSNSSSVTIQNSPFTVTIGATLDNPTSTLFANVVGGVTPYSYQWKKNAVVIAGANSDTLVINGIAGSYSVTVTDNNGLTATAQFTVQNSQQLFANNDTIVIYGSSTAITVSAGSVLTNDFYNSLPVNTNPNSSQGITLTPLTVPSGFSFNANGTISMLPGTANGLYTLTYQICLANNPNYCDTASVIINVGNTGILMKAFIDSNGNNVQDTGEQNFYLGQFHYEKNNDGIVNNVYSNGSYFINEANVATYDLSYTIDSPYNGQYALTVSSYADINYDPVSGVAVYNFPITALPFSDLEINLTPFNTVPRPGFVYKNLISYRNNGNLTIPSGSIAFTNDSAVTISAISQLGTTATATGFTYDFTNLLPNETRIIVVSMQVPTLPTVSLGQWLSNSVAISIPVGDIDVSNNISALTQRVVGAYDPNNKTESHGDKIIYSTFTSNDYLNYTIQFENTGTFYAENVRVNDILDAKLDETSVRMINASHANTLNRVGNTLNWNFNGVDLQPGEKGYINFEVKPKVGYAVGDIIPNAASIYFDFNPPIVTNTFQTEFVTSLSASGFEKGIFRVYPNPTNDVVTISLNENDTIDSVIVMDVLGKTIQTKTVNNVKATLDLSALTNGMYFLKIKTNGLEKVMKIMKQ